MATDKSEPRVGLIFKIGIASIVLLLGVRSALGAYFDRITQDEIHRKIVEAKPEALLNLRASEKDRLQGGHESIEQAMHDLVAKGRMNASPDVVPMASKDVAPLQGWARLPAGVPSPMIESEAEADAGVAPAASSAAPGPKTVPAVGPPPAAHGAATGPAASSPIPSGPKSTGAGASKKKP